MTHYDPAKMEKHPEGGAFREVFRSGQRVTTVDGRNRCAATHIYFSLESGEVSVFHRVSSDEIWNLYRGDGLTLYLLPQEGAQLEKIELSAKSCRYCHVVPAGWWQAAVPLAGKVLVGCTVAPGFEFEDFEIMTPAGSCGRYLLHQGAEYRRLMAS